ncbi:kinase-like domain-containing protein [Mycena amicta]|nr:kinase-like domain-containing protein [Mycena amicta]
MPMRVHLDSLIEYGGYCRVYVGQVKTSGVLPLESKVAVKKMHITKHVKNAMLMHEAAALLKLRGHESVPAVYAWGRSQFFEYLALQLLGPTLSISSAPTMRNLVAVTCQMFDAIEHAHKHGFIHGDIKPGNFLFGTGQDGSDVGRIYLIDYGLAKLYADPQTLTHISNGTIPALRGTQVYASLNMHYHRMPSRRDDIESLAYSILKLLRGSLPWRHVNSNEALRLKATSTGTALCGEYPPVFGEFLEYARSMSFEETPDYKKWRARFRQLVPYAEGDPLLYDPSDHNPPLAGTILDSVVPPAVDAQPDPAPASKDDDSIPDYDDGFFPTSTWAPPTGVKDEDLLGDERGTVARELEMFDGPPEMDKRYLQIRIPEVMETSEGKSPDHNPPLVGTILDSASPPAPPAHWPDPAPASEDEDSLPASNDGFFPTSTWAMPTGVKDEDLLGDERGIIARELEMFDGPPEMDKRYLHWQLRRPEVMVQATSYSAERKPSDHNDNPPLVGTILGSASPPAVDAQPDLPPASDDDSDSLPASHDDSRP